MKGQIMNESFPIPRSLIYVPRESPTVRCGAILRRALHILVLAAVIVFSGAARTAWGEETAVIAGTVLHAGKPVSGATIWLFADSSESNSAGAVGAAGGKTVYSDAKGFFSITNARAGTYQVFLYKKSAVPNALPDYAVSLVEGVTVTEGRTTGGMAVKLVRGGIITGRVTMDTGEPVPVQEVAASGYGMGITGENGVYRISTRPGNAQVYIMDGPPKGYLRDPLRFPVCPRCFHLCKALEGFSV